MAVLMALFFTYASFFALVDHEQVTWTVEERVFHPDGHEVGGLTICTPGAQEVILPVDAPFTSRLHELVHVVDCQDDGWANQWGDPEFYATWITGMANAGLEQDALNHHPQPDR